MINLSVWIEKLDNNQDPIFRRLHGGSSEYMNEAVLNRFNIRKCVNIRAKKLSSGVWVHGLQSIKIGFQNLSYRCWIS